MKKYFMIYLTYVFMVMSLILLAWYSVGQASSVTEALAIIVAMLVFHYKVNRRVCTYFEKKFL